MYTEPKNKFLLCLSAVIHKYELVLYVFKKYFIATLCETNVGEGLSKSSEMVLKMPN